MKMNPVTRILMPLVLTVAFGACDHASSTTARLRITKDGTGTGSVVSVPSLINCGDLCLAQVAGGTQITLTAAPAPDSDFTGWSGACSGTGSDCTLNIQQDSKVAATFAKKHVHVSISITGTGAGSIKAVGGAIDCPGTCEAELELGTHVRLEATPRFDSKLTAWVKGCTADGTACEFVADQANDVVVEFASLIPVQVTVNGPANGGHVVSNPSGIACGLLCEAWLDPGQQIELSAVPTDDRYRFQGWGGDCTGRSPTCSLTADAPRQATANFAAFYQWVRSLDVYPLKIAIADDGFVVAATEFSKPFKFGTETVVPLDYKGKPSVAVLWFDASGNPIRSMVVGKSGSEVRLGYIISHGGLTYLGGSFKGSFDIGNTTHTSTSTNYAGYLAILDATGNVLRSVMFPDTSVNVFIQGLSVNGLGQIAVGGSDQLRVVEPDLTLQRSGPARLLPQLADDGSITALDYSDGVTPICGEIVPAHQYVLINLSDQGICNWSWRPTGDGVIQFDNFVLSPQGQILVAGKFDGTLNAGEISLPGTPAANPHGWVALLDSARHTEWAVALHHLSGPYSEVTPQSVAFGPAGEAVVGGWFRGNIDFGAGTRNSQGQSSFLVVLGPGDGSHLLSRYYLSQGSSGVTDLRTSGNRFIAGGLFSSSIDWEGTSLTTQAPTASFVAGYEL